MALVRKGGEAEKLGFGYEELWRLSLLLEVIEETAEQIVFENFNEEFAAGVDAEVRRSGGTKFKTEFHSVKRQTSAGAWSMSALTSGGEYSILGHLVSKLNPEIADDTGLFITSSPASEFAALLDGTHRSQTLSVFRERLKRGSDIDRENLTKSFDHFCSHLAVEKEFGFHILRQLRLVNRQPVELEEDVERSIERALMRIDGQRVDPSAIANHLCDLMMGNLGPTLNRDSILGFLLDTSPGYCCQSLSVVPSAVAELNRQNFRFINEAEADLIESNFIDRAESQEILSVLKNNQRAWITLTGDAGNGKSVVLAKVIENMRESNIPILAFRFDTATPAVTREDLRNYLSLSWNPVTLLDGIANRGKSVLIIDQVDALSRVAGRRNAQQWAVLHGLIEEARNCPNMSIVLSCRKFDLRNDTETRRLLEGDHNVDVETREIEVGLLSQQAVEECLKRKGVNLTNWTDQSLLILRTPLHLKLFLQCRSRNDTPVESLTELYQRFSHLLSCRAEEEDKPWDFRSAVAKVVKCFEENQAVAIDSHAIRHSEIEVAKNRLVSIGVLNSFGSNESEIVRFFHDTLFDFFFAKLFITRNETLEDYLTKLGVRQDLFRRTQCRQILSFLREGSATDHERYIEELHSILSSGRIRPHLKLFILMWLGSVASPTDQEREAVLSCARNSSVAVDQASWQSLVLRLVLSGSVPWFDLFDKDKLWLDWLTGEDQRLAGSIGLALTLGNVLEERGELILSELLKEDSEVSRDWACHILRHSRMSYSPLFRETFVTAFHEDWSGLGRGYDFGAHLAELSQSHPKEAAEIFIQILNVHSVVIRQKLHFIGFRPTLRYRARVYLKSWWKDAKWGGLMRRRPRRLYPLMVRLGATLRGLESGLAKGTEGGNGILKVAGTRFGKIVQKILDRIFDIRRGEELDFHHLAEFLDNCRSKIPEVYVSTVISFVERVSKKHGIETAEYLCVTYETGVDSDYSSRLIRNFQKALANLAVEKPDVASGFVEKIQSLRLEAMEPIAALAWARNGSVFSDAAFAFFQSNPDRLFLQPHMWSGGNAAAYYGRTLLEAIEPSLSDDEIKYIEDLVLNHREVEPELKSIKRMVENRREKPFDTSDAEHRKDALRYLNSKDHARYHLLCTIPESRLSPAGRKKRSIWEGRFGSPDFSAPGLESSFTSVPSPVSRESIRKMSNSAFTGLFEKYQSGVNPDTPHEWSVSNLHSEVAAVVASDKERYLRYLEEEGAEIPDDARNCIVSALLGSNDEADSSGEPLSAQAFTDLIQSYATTDDSELAKSICRMIRARKDEARSQWIEILIGFALKHPDPATPEKFSITGSGSKDSSIPDFLTNGINHVRGTACHALAGILFANKSFSNEIGAAIPRLISDPSLGVRACVVELLIAWLNVNRSESLDWFLAMIEGQEQLLHSPVIEHYLFYADQEASEKLDALLKRMSSMSGEAGRFGVRQIARTSFFNESRKRELIQLLESDNLNARTHIASVAAECWKFESCRNFAEFLLKDAYKDSNPEVRREATQVFRYVKPDGWQDAAKISRMLLHSEAFLSEADMFLWDIKKASPVPVDLVIEIGQKVLDVWTEFRRDPERLGPLRWRSEEAGQLVLLAYNNSEQVADRERCLDLIDGFLLAGFYGISKLDDESQ